MCLGVVTAPSPAIKEWLTVDYSFSGGRSWNDGGFLGLQL